MNFLENFLLIFAVLVGVFMLRAIVLRPSAPKAISHVTTRDADLLPWTLPNLAIAAIAVGVIAGMILGVL